MLYLSIINLFTQVNKFNHIILVICVIIRQNIYKYVYSLLFVKELIK